MGLDGKSLESILALHLLTTPDPCLTATLSYLLTQIYPCLTATLIELRLIYPCLTATLIYLTQIYYGSLEGLTLTTVIWKA